MGTAQERQRRYLVDGNRGYEQIVAEYDEQGVLESRQSWGMGSELLGEEVRRADGSAPLRLPLSDLSGNVRQRVDGGGQVKSLAFFDGWGNGQAGGDAGAGEGGASGYGAERRDATGHLFLRARNYDTSNGRFLSHDSEAGGLNRPATLHRYTYAESDPVNASDPTGRETLAGLSVGIGMQGNIRQYNGNQNAYIAMSSRYVIRETVKERSRELFKEFIKELFEEALDAAIDANMPHPTSTPGSPIDSVPFDDILQQSRERPRVYWMRLDGVPIYLSLAVSMRGLFEIPLSASIGTVTHHVFDSIRLRDYTPFLTKVDYTTTDRHRKMTFNGTMNPKPNGGRRPSNVPSDYQWDEYPFADTLEWKNGVDWELVPGLQNSTQGWDKNGFYALYDVNPGDNYAVGFIP